MAIEGELVVRIATLGGRVTRAEARAERPRVAGRLFAGRLASEAPPLAGALFAICGRSQAIAAAAGIEAAGGAPRQALPRASRDIRIAAETIQEHSWRFLVDWPKLAGLPPAVETLAGGRKVLAPLLEAEEGVDRRPAVNEALAWAGRSLFGRVPAAFLALESRDQLAAWTREAGTSVAALAGRVLADHASIGAGSTAFLPCADDTWVAHTLAPAIDGDEAFDDVPHCNGEARETGPLARTAAHPLVADAIAAWGRGVGARLVARLVETAAALESIAAGGGERHGATDTGNGTGLAWVETARGLLVHRVALAGERIADYRIVAPTEWNFHPAGAFARGALGLAGDGPSGLESRVRWLVASLDPCVGVRYEATHA